METMKQSKSVSCDVVEVLLYVVCCCGCLQGKRVGVFVKDAFTGNFVDGWNEMLGSMKMSQVCFYCDGGDVIVM